MPLPDPNIITPESVALYYARRKFLLDKVPDAVLLYSPSLRLSNKITKSTELRRTSDEEEEEFSPEQWQGSAVTAFANLPQPKSFEAQINVTNFTQDANGWSGDKEDGAARVQRLAPFSIKAGQTVLVAFDLVGITYTIRLRDGETTNISDAVGSDEGANSILLTATSDSQDCRITFIRGSEVTGNTTVTNFTAIGEDRHNARATKIFDFSGNGNHATQTVAGSQPFAVTGGVLETENGKGVLRFDGVANRASSPAGSLPDVSDSIMAIRIVDFVSSGRILVFGDDNQTALTQTASTAETIRLELFIRTNGTSGRYRWDVPRNEFGVLRLHYDRSTITNTHMYWNGSLLTRIITTVPTGDIVAPTGTLLSIAGPVVFSPITFGGLFFYPFALTNAQAEIATQVLADYYSIDL